MNNKRILSLATLIVLSTTTIMHSMQLAIFTKAPTIEIYEPNTIANIKIKREEFKKIILNEKNVGPLNVISRITDLQTLNIFFKPTNTKFYQYHNTLNHSCLAAIMMASKLSPEYKRTGIHTFRERGVIATRKDKQFAFLECYERDQVQNPLYFIKTAKYKNQESLFALLPPELIHYISELIINTEKSLL